MSDDRITVSVYGDDVPCVIVASSRPGGLLAELIYPDDRNRASSPKELSDRICEAYRIVVIAAAKNNVELPIVDLASGSIVHPHLQLQPPKVASHE